MEHQAPAAATPRNDQLPPDADAAAGQLKGSPRHAEWVDVKNGEGTPIKSFVVYPERKDKAPVVIVIHEIFGLSDWVRGVADQLAKEGFIAIAPDFLSGKGPNRGGSQELGSQGSTQAIRDVTPEDTVKILECRPFVRAHHSVGKRQGRDNWILLGRRHQLQLRAESARPGRGGLVLRSDACRCRRLRKGQGANPRAVRRQRQSRELHD